jgi:hypothetical protein
MTATYSRAAELYETFPRRNDSALASARIAVANANHALAEHRRHCAAHMAGLHGHPQPCSECERLTKAAADARAAVTKETY